MTEIEKASDGPTASRLFDLRTMIAVLFGVYGIVLTVQGAFLEDQAQLDKAAGIDINLWSGIVMFVVAVVFLLWVWLRPLVPSDGAGERGTAGSGSAVELRLAGGRDGAHPRPPCAAGPSAGAAASGLIPSRPTARHSTVTSPTGSTAAARRGFLVSAGSG
jgi:hypothetical protein